MEAREKNMLSQLCLQYYSIVLYHVCMGHLFVCLCVREVVSLKLQGICTVLVHQRCVRCFMGPSRIVDPDSVGTKWFFRIRIHIA